MESELKVKIKRSFLDNYHRPLHLHPEFIQFEDKDLINNGFTTFKSSEIKDFRCGVNWFQYYFVFGREYEFHIRNLSDEVLKIKFNSYFGIKKREQHKLYTSIIDSLWNLYFNNQVNDFLKEFETGESFYIGDVVVNPKGIIIKVSKLTKLEKIQIPWDDLRFKLYRTYFSVYSKNNPTQINRGYSYKEDWNTFVLHNVIKIILSNKKINND
ncbi:hypothetical protein SAMN05444397_102576 [Flavobacterium aquidurense]|uniref:Uncharacterized protein n=1 Tax=Flavobacterium frigidimaris TaxID=262320 RepID=A0ABX4BMN4_FLAFR|nr:hypothetical protein [Flavobacterium frigidimaris]OXA77547.1 hypothetical protein B0A65_15945 [Flavobacterium frigidimaris]SDY90339.1 hypothetical protein SAMN05444397_102576 [Flavobacterium aquidurense]